MNELGTYVAECRRKVESGRKAAGTIRSLVNARGLQVECCMRSRIRAVQMDNRRGVLGIRRMNRVPNVR